MSLRTALPATGLALLLAACSSIQPDPGAPGRAGAAAGACHAEAVAWAVGQPADEAVTRDFRADRVNVHIDRDNRISAVSCG